MGALTAKQVEALKEPGRYGDGGGLYLIVSGIGAKSWLYRYQIAGKRREKGLGSAGAVSLKEARDKAEAARKLVSNKIDPINHEKAEAAAKAAEEAAALARAVTFEEAANAYVESNEPGWRNDKHKAQWKSTLKHYVYPVIGKHPVGAIDTPMVLKIIEPIWRTKTETAGRIRGRIEAVLDNAKARGLRSGENPARWKGHLDQVLPSKRKVRKTRHHPSLPYQDMRDFWPKLQAWDGLGARALEFGILTATRSTEIRLATWDEIDLNRALWTIPEGRMKGEREHRVPLSTEALFLLRKMAAIRTGPFLFAGQRKDRPLSDMSLTMPLRRMKLSVTAHGFRSTFRTWAAECTNFPREIAEAALAHAIESEVEQAYQRSDHLEKRRKLMEAWAGFITAKPAKVIPMNRARS